MTPHEMLMALSTALEKEGRLHLEVANQYLKNDSIFLPRMAATHVLGSINTALIALAQEVSNAKRTPQ